MMTSLFKNKPAVVAKTTRKRGRPFGSKNTNNDNALVKKPAANTTFKHSDSAALQNLMRDNLQLIQDNKQLLFKIELLEHKIIGFRAVVSYLEVQAGLKVTQ
jgi:hypothetical protein